MRQAVAQARPCLGKLVCDIAAGLPLQALGEWLGSQRVVRAMPNTAALVGADVNGFGRSGRCVCRSDERASGHAGRDGPPFLEATMNVSMPTAASGSGPAYVFHFFEAFQTAAEWVCFLILRLRATWCSKPWPARWSRLRVFGEAFSVLRERGTSQRGTTEAALQVLRKSHPEARLALQFAQPMRAAELVDRTHGHCCLRSI